MKVYRLPEPPSYRETPEEYAARRAKETGAAYIVTDNGHAMWDTPFNRRAIREIGLTVSAVFPGESHNV